MKLLIQPREGGSSFSPLPLHPTFPVLPPPPVLSPISSKAASTLAVRGLAGALPALPLFPENAALTLLKSQWERRDHGGRSLPPPLPPSRLPRDLSLPQPSFWDRWKSNNNPIKVSDTMARWRRAGEELGTRGLLQVVFHWLWIPTGRTLAIRFTD